MSGPRAIPAKVAAPLLMPGLSPRLLLLCAHGKAEVTLCCHQDAFRATFTKFALPDRDLLWPTAGRSITHSHAVTTSRSTQGSATAAPTSSSCYGHFPKTQTDTQDGSSSARTTRRGIRQTTVKQAISAARFGPKSLGTSGGSGACVSFPHSGYEILWHRYSVICGWMGGNSVTWCRKTGPRPALPSWGSGFSQWINCWGNTSTTSFRYPVTVLIARPSLSPAKSRLRGIS